MLFLAGRLCWCSGKVACTAVQAKSIGFSGAPFFVDQAVDQAVDQVVGQVVGRHRAKFATARPSGVASMARAMD